MMHRSHLNQHFVGDSLLAGGGGGGRREAGGGVGLPAFPDLKSANWSTCSALLRSQKASGLNHILAPSKHIQISSLFPL